MDFRRRIKIRLTGFIKKYVFMLNRRHFYRFYPSAYLEGLNQLPDLVHFPSRQYNLDAPVAEVAMEGG